MGVPRTHDVARVQYLRKLLIPEPPGMTRSPAACTPPPGRLREAEAAHASAIPSTVAHRVALIKIGHYDTRLHRYDWPKQCST